MTHTQIRIISGSLRGRPIDAEVHPGLRPTPLRVRESLFSILGHAVPGRPFIDVFAGTGVNGFEAISRGASEVVFVERDGRLVESIEKLIDEFQVGDRARVVRGDVYRWADRWVPPTEAVNLYLSPPFSDLSRRAEEFHALLAGLQAKLPTASVLTVQLEEPFEASILPGYDRWDVRTYGRNVLAFWEPTGVNDSLNGHVE